MADLDDNGYMVSDQVSEVYDHVILRAAARLGTLKRNSCKSESGAARAGENRRGNLGEPRELQIEETNRCTRICIW